MRAKHLFTSLFIVGVLLLFPLITVQFTNELKWTVSNFVILSIMIILAGFAINYTLSNAPNKGLKTFVITSIVIIFVLVWLELTVGIFGI